MQMMFGLPTRTDTLLATRDPHHPSALSVFRQGVSYAKNLLIVPHHLGSNTPAEGSFGQQGEPPAGVFGPR
jgi:hypothetical protein